jgi:hypothetical protein
MLGNKEIYCTTGENMLFLTTFSTVHYQSDDATDSATVSQHDNHTIDPDDLLKTSNHPHVRPTLIVL